MGDYKDSNIRMLTGTLKADWIQIPVERYLAALPTLKQGVIAGVFKIKGASPWAITRAEKLHVPSMWGNIRPLWRLLQQHLETKGPGWYSLAEREERLFTNRSNRPGDDMKDELRTDNDSYAWSTWRTSQDQLWQLRQPAPPVEFPGEQGMLTSMYAQVREEEHSAGRLVRQGT